MFIFRKILFLFLFLYSGNITAQSKTFNLMGLSDYFISSELNGSTNTFTMYSITNITDDSKKVKFSLSPLTKESFTQNFFISLAKFQDKFPEEKQGLNLTKAKGEVYNVVKAEKEKSPAYKKLEDEATKLFYLFVARSIIYDDLGNEPVAGTIYYVDSLVVLRKDVDQQSLHRDRAMKQLWKIYKQDKKSLKKLIKKEILDDKLSSEEISIRTLNTRIRKYNKANSGKDSISLISKKAEYSELIANLKKRKFKQKKEMKFLKERANNYQNSYETTLNELNKKTKVIEAQVDSVSNYFSFSNEIDSIKLLENRKQIYKENLSEKFYKLRLEIREIRELSIVLFDLIGKYKLDLDLKKLHDSQINFRQCMYTDSINSKAPHRLIYYGNDRCDVEFKTLNKEISIVASKLRAWIEKDSLPTNIELENLRTAYEILIQDSILLNDAIPKNINSYYKNAVSLDSLSKVQLVIVSQVKLISERNNILSKIKELNPNPKVFSGIKMVSYPDWLPSMDSTKTDFESSLVSNPLILSLDTMKKDRKEMAERLEERIKGSKKTRDTLIQKLAKQEDNLIFKDFKVDSIVIEINEGFIENILVVGKVKEYTDKYGHLNLSKDGKIILTPRTLKFENSSPIGFSRKMDFDAIKGKKLYTRGGERIQYEMYIEDLLSAYIQDHEVGRRDYSPANQKVVLKKRVPGTTADLKMGLKKEATYRLFEAKIFSDFVGLDETAPNGLIQTEVSKRINLLTSRKPFQFFSLAGMPNEWNVGFLSYLEPSLTLSKIEGNNKYLLLESKDRFINNQYAPIKFTSTLQLKQFENFSASATANLLLLDMPNIKSTFFVNWGFRYGRTGIQDSIRTATNGIVDVNQEAVLEYGVNTFDHSPELIWSVYADERYGFSMSWQHHWFYLRDNGFEQVANTTFFENQVIEPNKSSNQYNTFRFLTTLEQSSSNKGRLFFRYTYNWQQGFWNTGFHQAQVGYSFYLLGRPKN